jgi:hypothetical protein
LNSSVLLVFNTRGELKIYPDNDESIEQLRKYKDLIQVTEHFDGFGIIDSSKLNQELTAIKNVWNVSWYGGPQEILTFAQSNSWHNPRKKQITIGIENFTKPEGGLTAFTSINLKLTNASLHILNSQTGHLLYVKELLKKTKEEIPLLAAYDNAVVVGLVKEGEVMVIEHLVSSRVAMSSEVEVGKASLEELRYWMITSLKVSQKMSGIKMIRVEDKDLIIVVTNESLSIIDFDKMERGKHNTITELNSKTIKLPEKVKFTGRLSIEYNEDTRSVMVLANDIFTTQLT